MFGLDITWKGIMECFGLRHVIICFMFQAPVCRWALLFSPAGSNLPIGSLNISVHLRLHDIPLELNSP